MPAKDIPNYVTHYKEVYNDGSNEVVASIICPVCAVQMRKAITILRPTKQGETDAKNRTSEACQKILLKHLEEHYHNGKWGRFDSQPQIYDYFQPKSPTRWQRIKWAPFNKKNKEEMWVI